VVEVVQQVVLGLLLVLALPADLNNAWSAAVVGIGGVIVAFWVAKEKLLAALTAGIKAVLALVVTVGFAVDPAVETGLVMAVSAAVTFWLRSQVTAPVDANGNKVTVVDGQARVVSERRLG
jgi:hypothetical protein